jgi:hypothetical protein
MTRAVDAVAGLYHAWITGLVLTLLNRRDAATAEAFVFHLFRRQHLERFLPGLDKLGLRGLPDAVAAARYHYFSNQLGGVAVEYLEVSPRKAWIRYPPPRWIWMGTAVCAIPSAVNRAMLRGWHAHNGVSLGNPRLGFVCTGTTVDGQPGLEGYYREFDDELAASERLQFRPAESAPFIDPRNLPRLDAVTWPAERQAKAYRNYALEYLRNGLPLLTQLLGPEEARFIGRISGLQIGMQCYRDIATRLVVDDRSAASMANLLNSLLAAQGEDVSRDGLRVTQRGSRLFRGLAVHDAADDAVAALWEGLTAAHNRFLRLTRRRDGEVTHWHVAE